jgi:hypothetical protein
MRINLKWDDKSDQPDIIRDRALKRKIYKSIRWDSLKLLVTNLFLYPVSYLVYLISPSQKSSVNTQEFFGVGVNLDKNPKQTRALIDDLAINNLLIRMPLHDIENIEKYVIFAEQFKDKKLLINVLQDRRHVEDLVLLKASLTQIFEQFSPLTSHFQIGNAINRKKWAIFSMDEYLRYYKVAYDLKNKQFPDLILLGSSVIDFEYYFTLRTLFNFHKVRFDQCSSLLYVDRRGAPENTQMGFDLVKKLRFLHAILRLSPKTGTDIIVSETNWPLVNTKPYSPTSETECVTLEEQADYLVRYYLLALSTGVVKQVYWHQLIAPGYGLIDNRGDILNKYPAYQAFKVMLSYLKGAELLGVKNNINGNKGSYQASFQSGLRKIDVVWALTTTTIKSENKQIVSRDGVELAAQQSIDIGPSPIYLIQ